MLTVVTVLVTLSFWLTSFGRLVSMVRWTEKASVCSTTLSNVIGIS